jgi:hypothetical protein
MNRTFFIFFGVISLVTTQQCVDHSRPKQVADSGPSPDPIFTPFSLPQGFNEYWYAGVAELSTYDVVQDRYDEIRQAEQINVFVTEDFSKAKHVKLDYPEKAGADRVPILKLNALRRFETGIYDYSLMQSVFTPVSGMPTLKTSTSVQDWCGHVFMQMDLAANAYRSRTFSYFEQEGDQDITLPFVLLEDELWTRLRLNPLAIKTGKMKVLPSALYSRLRHKPLEAQDADIQLQQGDKETVLSLQYLQIARSLKIRFETNFPYKILGWEESNEGKIASKGTLKASRRSAYWSEHNNINAPLRDSLALKLR